MKSSELMKMAEKGLIEKGRIVIDQEKNEFVFTGKSFQLLSKAEKNKFYGLCIDDSWIIADEIINM